MAELTIAIAKGRLQISTLELLTKAGLLPDNDFSS